MGLLMTPRNHTDPKGLPWAMDNDAFSGFDIAAYCKMLASCSRYPNPLFVVAPDVVGDAKATMRRFMEWHPILTEFGYPVAYVLQNGLEGVGVPWELCSAVFVGGDTPFKYTEIVRRTLCEAKDRGKWVHFGRVNTQRRIEYVASLGTVDSFDGSQFSRWSKTHLRRGALSTEHVQAPLAAYEEAR